MVEDRARRAHWWRRFLPVVVAIAAAGILFSSFLIANFPYDATVSRMLAPYQLKLAYQEQHMSIPIGVALANVTLTSNTAFQHPSIVLQSPLLELRPTIGSLLFGEPGLSLVAHLYDGTVQATVHQQQDVVDVAFRVATLSLAQSRPLAAFGVLLGGSLSAAGSGDLRGTDLDASSGQGTLEGRDITVEPIRGFPPIHLGSVTGRILMMNNTVTFQDIETHGSDLDTRSDGAIQLAPDPADSTIAARIYLTPTASGRDRFEFFLHMLPHPPSAGPYDLRGSITEPSIS